MSDKAASIIDRAKSHYRELGERRIEVPEWGDESGPLVIFATPFTLAEKNKLYRLAKDDNLELLAYTLILKALDKDGNKLFTLEHKHALVNSVDSNVLARVAAQIGDSTPPEVMEKN